MQRYLSRALGAIMLYGSIHVGIALGGELGSSYWQCLNYLRILDYYQKGDHVSYDEGGWFRSEKVTVKGASCEFNDQEVTSIRLASGVSYRKSEIERIAKLPTLQHVLLKIDKGDFSGASGLIREIRWFEALSRVELDRIEVHLAQKLASLPESESKVRFTGYKVLLELTNKAEYREKMQHYSRINAEKLRNRNSNTYTRGPRGGCFFIRGGERVYVDRSLCFSQ